MTRTNTFVPHTYARPTILDVNVEATDWFLYEATDIPEDMTIVEYRRQTDGARTVGKRRRFPRRSH
jgi:hypothetical protein